MTILPSSFNFNGPFPRQTRRLRLGIVGGGRISQTQAMAARMTDRWDIIAGAFSSDPANAKLRGEDWNVAADRSYTNFQAMAAAEATREDGIDAVMVTTPNHAHYAAARDFLESGIDVICDKPLTNNLAEAEHLEKLAGEKGLVFAVCYTCLLYTSPSPRD